MTTALRSLLLCPHCGRSDWLPMPADACVVVHDCAGCGAELRPKPGDCCVFCSYGSTPCPPVQASQRDMGDAPTESVAIVGQAGTGDGPADA